MHVTETSFSLCWEGLNTRTTRRRDFGRFEHGNGADVEAACTVPDNQSTTLIHAESISNLDRRYFKTTVRQVAQEQAVRGR